MTMDSSVSTYTQLSLDLPTLADIPDNYDILLRLKQSSVADAPLFAYIGETVSFMKSYIRPFVENQVLHCALNNLWLTHQYNREYISFLLKTSSREEFLSKAKEFARSFQELEPELLEAAVHTVMDHLGQSLTSAELSLFLNVEPTSIDNAIKTLPEPCSDDTENT